MDYYNMQNLISDTKMREAISNIGKTNTSQENEKPGTK